MCSRGGSDEAGRPAADGDRNEQKHSEHEYVLLVQFVCSSCTYCTTMSDPRALECWFSVHNIDDSTLACIRGMGATTIKDLQYVSKIDLDKHQVPELKQRHFLSAVASTLPPKPGELQQPSPQGTVASVLDDYICSLYELISIV
jgi:hypothetical protein